jgi:hypothetical protein
VGLPVFLPKYNLVQRSKLTSAFSLVIRFILTQWYSLLTYLLHFKMGVEPACLGASPTLSREGAEEARRIDKCPPYDRVPESRVALDLMTTFRKVHSNFVAKLYLTSVSQRCSIFDLADSAVLQKTKVYIDVHPF